MCVFFLSLFLLFLFFKQVKAVKSQDVFVFLVIPGVGAHHRKTTCIMEGRVTVVSCFQSNPKEKQTECPWRHQ